MAAIDERGAELCILMQKRRDKEAAERFFIRVLRSCPLPRKIVADQLHAPNADLLTFSLVESGRNSQRSLVSRGFRGFSPDTTNGNLSNGGA